MADDRLDDAIDAVVRAVDRIERATRGVLDAPMPQQPYGAQSEDVYTASRGPGAGFGERNATKTGPAVPSSPPFTPPTDAPPASGGEPEAEAPVFPPVPPAQPVPPVAPAPLATPADASPEVHELIGRIVARTQTLEEHLTAARTLRADLSELVNQLAAATSRG